MDKIYYNTLAHNIYQLKAAGEVIKTLQDSNISVMVLKGAALLETVYPDPGIRPMADIDLLVHSCNLNKSEDIFRKLNFSLLPTGELHYIKKEGTLFAQVDLHWDIWYIKEPNDIWLAAIKTHIAGVETLIMSPEDAVIYTAVHSAVHHGMFRDVWAQDLLKIIEHYKTLDWNEIIEKACKYNVATPLFCLFLRINLPVPSWAMKRLSPPLSKKLDAMIFSLFLNNPPADNAGHILRFCLEKGLYGKIRFLLRFLFPAPSFLKRRYNLSSNYKICLYYLIRPFYIVINTFRLLVNLKRLHRFNY